MRRTPHRVLALLLKYALLVKKTAIASGCGDMWLLGRWVSRQFLMRQMQSFENSARMDHSSFAAEYRDVYPRLSLIAIGIIGDRVYADDIVQDATIIALRKLEEFSPGTSFGAWMAAIVRRCALNYAKKTRNRATFAADPRSLDRSRNLAAPETPEVGVSQTGMLLDDQHQFDDDVVHALGALNEVARCCLLLRTIMDLSYDEISQLMDIPKGTAMSHVHRSKAAMRHKLMGKYCLQSRGGEDDE